MTSQELVTAAIAAAFRRHTPKSASVLGFYLTGHVKGIQQIELRNAVTGARESIVTFPAADAVPAVQSFLAAVAAERKALAATAAALAANTAERKRHARKALHRTAAA